MHLHSIEQVTVIMSSEIEVFNVRKMGHKYKNQRSKNTIILKMNWGISLAVQWLRLCNSTAGGTGSIPGLGTKIPHAAWRENYKKKKK